LLIDLPFVLLLFIGFLGSLYVIDKNLITKNYLNIELLISLLLLIGITYGSGLLGIDSIQPARWFSFIEVLLVMFASNGLLLILSKISKINHKILVSLPLFFIFIFSSISSPLSNTDSTFYANETVKRAALIQSEVSATIFFKKYYTRTEVLASLDYMSLVVGVINPVELNITRNSLLAIRKYDVEYGFIVISPFPFYPDSAFYNYINSLDKAYDNYKVQAYFKN
jgi:hypothetical protein